MVILYLLVLVSTAIYLYVYLRDLKRRKNIEKAYFLRGFVYVEIKTQSGDLLEGFTTRAQLRLVKERRSVFQLVLESYKIGEKKIVPSTSIDWVKQLRPPE